MYVGGMSAWVRPKRRQAGVLQGEALGLMEPER